jgi:hypothetical protein
MVQTDEERKAKIKQYAKKYREKNKEKINVRGKKFREELKLEVFSTLSKLHSKSKIPCCRCCGESSHIEFLTIEHIEGRKNLPKKEQKLKGEKLNSWLKKNDYPDGFEVLCWNCNLTKGSFGHCPHEELKK